MNKLVKYYKTTLKRQTTGLKMLSSRRPKSTTLFLICDTKGDV